MSHHYTIQNKLCTALETYIWYYSRRTYIWSKEVRERNFRVGIAREQKKRDDKIRKRPGEEKRRRGERGGGEGRRGEKRWEEMRVDERMDTGDKKRREKKTTEEKTRDVRRDKKRGEERGEDRREERGEERGARSGGEQRGERGGRGGGKRRGNTRRGGERRGGERRGDEEGEIKIWREALSSQQTCTLWSPSSAPRRVLSWVCYFLGPDLFEIKILVPFSDEWSLQALISWCLRFPERHFLPSVVD